MLEKQNKTKQNKQTKKTPLTLLTIYSQYQLCFLLKKDKLFFQRQTPEEEGGGRQAH